VKNFNQNIVACGSYMWNSGAIICVFVLYTGRPKNINSLYALSQGCKNCANFWATL